MEKGRRRLVKVAERFRFYAALCLAQAERSVWSAEQRERFLHDAARWEQEARTVMRTAEMIREMRSLMAEIDSLLARRP